MSILFEHIILKLMCFLWNSGHFSSHFRTFLVEFCRDRRLRAFFVNSGLFSSHFRTFIVEFCRDRRLRAFPKILKILASSLFSLPCLTIFLTLFEPNSEWHPWLILVFGYEISTPLLTIRPAVKNRGWVTLGDVREMDTGSQTDFALINWQEMISVAVAQPKISQ